MFGNPLHPHLQFKHSIYSNPENLYFYMFKTMANKAETTSNQYLNEIMGNNCTSTCKILI